MSLLLFNGQKHVFGAPARTGAFLWCCSSRRSMSLLLFNGQEHVSGAALKTKGPMWCCSKKTSMSLLLFIRGQDIVFSDPVRTGTIPWVLLQEEEHVLAAVQ